MKQEIQIGDNYINIISIYNEKKEMLGSLRSCLRIKLESTYEEVSELFQDGIQYTLISYVENADERDENGDPIVDIIQYDKSDFSLACDIVDHRDGTLDVYMGKLTTEEELLIQLYSGGVC